MAKLDMSHLASQTKSLFGHMMQAAQKSFLAPVRFLGNATIQAAERIVPHGASELGASLYTGSAYAPPGVTERLTPPRDLSNVHGTGAGQQQAAPVQHAPQESYADRLKQQAARMADRPREEGRGR